MEDELFQLSNGRYVTSVEISEKLTYIKEHHPETSYQEDSTGYSWDEAGMADLFSECYDHDTRYCPEAKSWYTYDGGKWQKDVGSLLVSNKIKEFVRIMALYCGEIPDEDKRKQYMAFVGKMGDRRFRDRLMKDAADNLKIAAAEFDTHPFLINCKNGTYDLESLTFREHKWDDFLTMQTNFEYGVKKEKCARWEQFIKEVTQNDKDKADYLQRALGYSILGTSKEECMFILHGKTTRNGKSTMDRISYKDSKGITHDTIVTNVNFVMNQSTEIAGKGETTQNESYDKNNGLTKQQATILETIRKKVENSLSSREQATLEMNRLLANSLGLYMTGVKQDNGSTKYYFHDGETLETSNIIYTFQANGFAWTKNWNKGEPVWEYGVTKDGNAVLQMLAAYKLTADYIEAGSITADKIATDYKESVTTEIEEKIDDKLVDYSTKTDMESAIKQQADSITLMVSKNISEIYETTDSALKAAATMMIVNDDTGKTYQGAIKVIGGKPVFEYDEVVTG